METFKISVQRKPDEAVAAWRDRAMDVARADAKARGLLVKTLRLRGSKGAAILADGAHAIEVVVEYERAGPAAADTPPGPS